MTGIVVCPECRRPMAPERRDGVELDRCAHCNGLWFDASELDRVLAPTLTVGVAPPEARIPKRGLTVRTCPRCGTSLRCAGWDGLVLERCETCRGIYVDVRDWKALQRGDVPDGVPAFEQEIRDFMLGHGWTIAAGGGFIQMLLRLVR